jgi:hypothetical protein
MGDFQYAFRVGLVKGVPGLQARGTFDKDIGNPLKECVVNLTELSEIESDNPRVIALQVLQFSRLAVEDPWKLSREQAVRALGPLAKKLAVPLDLKIGKEPAGPADVREAAARLVNAARSTLDFGELDPTLPEDDLAAACARIDAMQLDRAGALRLLRAGALLESVTSKRDERVQPLRETLVHLQRVCLHESLHSALWDRPPNPTGGAYPGWGNERVRGAAATACIQAFGDEALRGFLEFLPLELEPHIATAIFGQIHLRGLPADAPEATPEEAAELRERWIQVVLQHAIDNPSGTVRVSAMRALETISDGAVRSLREEDWLEWHAAR